MTEKIAKLQELNKEINSIKLSFKTDMFNFIIGEFKKRGFVTDPRGKGFERSLYNPELKVSIHIGNISNMSAGISVIDMVNDGMNWGNAYRKLSNGTEIRFNFLKYNFEEFYNTTFKNRVKKLDNILVGL
jgi:hypothetical protein